MSQYKTEPASNQDMQKLVDWIVCQLRDEQKYTFEVVDSLVEKGMDRGIAEKIVDDIWSKLEEKESKGSITKIILGVLIAVGGVVLTLFLFSAGWIASITIGMIVWGCSMTYNGMKKYNI